MDSWLTSSFVARCGRSLVISCKTKQIKGVALNRNVKFSLGSTFWELLAGVPKKCRCNWRQRSLGRKHKTIRQRAEMSGAGKSVWYVLKKKETLVSSLISKGLEDHMNQQKWWKTFHIIYPSKEFFEGGRHVIVTGYNQETPSWIYRGFTTRYKPLVAPQIREVKLDFTWKHLKGRPLLNWESLDKQNQN